jgi:uncharacterized damage-inducible protein DinB
MFATVKDAVATLSSQANITRSVLAAVPETSWSWKPQPISRSAGELAWHVATGLHWFVADALKLRIPPKPAAAPATSAAVVEAFDALARDCIAAVKNQDDAWIRMSADFFGTPTTNGGILGTQVIHEAHHRGQLSTYIRINGGKVPAICGPSADAR